MLTSSDFHLYSTNQSNKEQLHTNLVADAARLVPLSCQCPRLLSVHCFKLNYLFRACEKSEQIKEFAISNGNKKAGSPERLFSLSAS